MVVDAAADLAARAAVRRVRVPQRPERHRRALVLQALARPVLVGERAADAAAVAEAVVVVLVVVAVRLHRQPERRRRISAWARAACRECS